MTDFLNAAEQPDIPFCGAFSATVRLKYQVTSNQKVYYPAVLLFTDAVVFVQAPVRDRVAKVAGAVLAGAFTGNSDKMVSLASGGVERQAEWVNDQMAQMFDSIGRAAKITYHDVVRWYGEWATVWPNDKVVKVTMTAKNVMFGMGGKYLAVTIKARYPSQLNLWANPQDQDWFRQVLKKAFGDRFVTR